MRKRFSSSILPVFFQVFLCAVSAHGAESLPPLQEEVKLLIRENQIDRALESLGARKRDAHDRWIYFFDTPRISLFQKGLILRGRTSNDESTVKLRPADPSKIPAEFRSTDGFKCEIDRSARDAVTSCSISISQKSGEVGRVGAGKREPKKLFSETQENFARFGLGRKTPPWDSIRVFGPIHAFEWEIHGGQGIGTFELELWKLPSGKRFLEASLRVPAGSGAGRLEAIARYFAKRGIRVRVTGTSKTLGALQDLL